MTDHKFRVSYILCILFEKKWHYDYKTKIAQEYDCLGTIILRLLKNMIVLVPVISCAFFLKKSGTMTIKLRLLKNMIVLVPLSIGIRNLHFDCLHSFI